MTKPLSPAAQAVLDAYINAPCGKPRSVWVAAALRAAADQVVPNADESLEDSLAQLIELGDDPLGDEEIAVLRLSIAFGMERNTLIRSQLLAIATELEAQ